MGLSINYVWDEAKSASNYKKHGISFEDACQIFDDPNIISLYDEEHSNQDETRWFSLGQIKNNLVCVVIHRDHEDSNEETIRIISAREATRNEKLQYYGR